MTATQWNNEKFEQNVEKQVKRLHNIIRSPSVNFHVPQDSKCFDQFLLVGIPPNKTSDSLPELLLVYPPIALPEIGKQRILSLCLPTGPKRDYLRQNGTEPIQDEFVFTIANNDEVIYGTCVHLNVNKNKKRYPFFASAATSSTIYAFCLLSHSPVISAHLTFLSNLALSTLKLFKMDQIPEVLPPFFDMSNIIQDMELNGNVAHHSSLDVPSDFVKKLMFYYSKKCTSPPFEISKDVSIFFPSIENSDCLLWLSLDTIFSVLSLELIMKLITELIVDAQVLVIGKSLQEVSMTVIALQQLIKPFKFCGPVIPVLPNTPDFFNILMSPTPFIIGVPPCPELSSYVFLDSAIIIYLDKKNTPFPTKVTFPSETIVLENIIKILSKEKSKTPHPFSFSGNFKHYLNHKFEFSPDTSSRILNAIHEPLNLLYSDDLYGFFVTNIDEKDGSIVSIFNTDLFLASIKDENKLFYQHLIESQNFQIFIEKKIMEMQEIRDSSHVTTNILNESRKLSPKTRTKSISKDMLD